MKSTTVCIAIVLSVSAITTAIGYPIYIDYEHTQALVRQAKWDAQAAKERRRSPENRCADDHYRVIDNSGAFTISIPVWTDNGIVECSSESNSYSVNGQPITQEEADYYAMEALRQDFINESQYTSDPSPLPVVDVINVVEKLTEWLSQMPADKRKKIINELSADELSLLGLESK